MYSFEGCYLKNDICLNNFFMKNIHENSNIEECNNIAKINNAPFFAMSNGNLNNSSCLIGNDVSINENITVLSNKNNKINIKNISKIDFTKIPNACGYNNENNKTDIYASSNAYSLYTSQDSMLLYNNKDLLNKTYENPYYFNNWLKTLDSDFNKITTNLKNAYLEYIRSKSEAQDFNDYINEPANIKSKKENLIQIITDLIKLDNNYNNLINELFINSKIIFEKLNIYKSSTGLLENDFLNNKEILEDLLNTNNGENGQLINNNLKKNNLITQNILLLILIVIIIIILKKNR
jgi:hypothetical protein